MTPTENNAVSEWLGSRRSGGEVSNEAMSSAVMSIGATLVSRGSRWKLPASAVSGEPSYASASPGESTKRTSKKATGMTKFDRARQIRQRDLGPTGRLKKL